MALAAVRALRVGVLLALAHLHARTISRVPRVAAHRSTTNTCLTSTASLAPGRTMSTRDAKRRSRMPDAVLIITADDYGYAPGYNRGILEAADARAVDAVSAMVGRRWCDPAPLVATGTEVGLHLELPGPDLDAQLARFEELFGRPPDYLDGHHHCHARPDLTETVARTAAQRELPVRSVDSGHRHRLRASRAITQDLLLGRIRPSSPVLPTPLAADGALPSGVTEWMVHPGYRDAGAGSSYDAAREEDLELVLGISAELRQRVRRETHRQALQPR